MESTLYLGLVCVMTPEIRFHVLALSLALCRVDLSLGQISPYSKMQSRVVCQLLTSRDLIVVDGSRH